MRTGCYCGLLLTACLIPVPGCGRTPAEAAKSGATPVPILAAGEMGPALAPAPRPAPQAQDSPPPAGSPFRFPDDTGGEKVAEVLSPAAPPVPEMPTTTKPGPRTSLLDGGELPAPAVAPILLRSPLARARVPRPTPPPEVVPADLGEAAGRDPAFARVADRPLLRASAPPDPGAADLPPLARPVADRASLDDPTAELAVARVVFTSLPLPVTSGWFLRFGIPEPFELAAHLRGQSGHAGELGTTPVAVPPGRP